MKSKQETAVQKNDAPFCGRAPSAFSLQASRNKEPLISSLMHLLEEGIDSIRNEAQFAKYLKVISRFPSYSARNCMLIYRQMPDATLVCGFSTWKTKFKRHVRKGEQSIRIFAPVVKVEKSRDPKTGSVHEERQVFFRAVSVFDISQTAGEPLPDPPQPDVLQGNFDALIQSSALLEKLTGFKICFKPMSPECRGLCSYDEGRIEINENLSEAHAFKTLIHECTHALLHNPLDEHCYEEEVLMSERSIREAEAESSAFIVCCALGLDSSSYSLPYVALWSQGKKPLAQSLERIEKTASRILDALSPVIQPASLSTILNAQCSDGFASQISS